ncbi:MAG: RagB/SusD family nutrient uptake outer membrane protein [Prevotella sp.]
MKTLRKIFPFLGILLLATSCDDFLDKQPIDKVDASAWFATETDLELYANGLIQSYLPSESSIGLGDAYCDLVCTKTSSDYYRPGIWNSSKQTGWAYSDWENIRRANYMLENMTRSKGKVDDDVYLHYEGVARFWRALFYYNKVRTFGDVPWLDHVPEQTDSILYASRDDREYVMHQVLEDLNVACSQLKGNGKYVQNRTIVNRWVALALKSRVCLFEGTYRKYHSTNPSTGKPWSGRYESADSWLRECVKASEELIAKGPFTLYSTGNPATDYRTIFTSTDPFATNEVIWIRECANAPLNVFNELTWNFNSSTYGQQYAPTKNLLDMYLKTDGTPISTDCISPENEFEGRDWRLTQTVHAPGHTYLTNAGVTKPKALNFTYTFSGYQFMKWSIEEEANYSKARSNNSLPIMRLAEVLLNEAEAKAELGEMDEKLWNSTVGALRERAGVRNIYPLSANYAEDKWLKDYYSASPSLSNVLLEIRRERVTELIMEEGLRVDDLYRWKLGQLIADRGTGNKGWKGIYITPTAYTDGFTFNGTTYGGKTSKQAIWSKTSATSYKIGTTQSNGNFTLTDNDHGYLIYNYKLKWDDRMYVHPIPDAALTLNPSLRQNAGWEE